MSGSGGPALPGTITSIVAPHRLTRSSDAAPTQVEGSREYSQARR